ncbi:hypothetical protein [Sphingomonas sp. CFBP 8760]|uniref:hypothetical protein n=1 Tax=Sphingomonas sp. CFBP 8760 TaxID=2775282 RepID=UPI00177D7550|nr:hypothetical protein [Sphingomonas sp. CFBP 8760]MBD8548971.1 hypothetical protein [Sphingomonas sp. CFBP 8760]
MAVHALITGAPTRAPILDTVLTQIGACGAFPATPLHLSSATREWLGDMVETLLAILDHADGDADLEDGDLDRCSAGEDGPKVDAAFDLLWKDAA